MIKELLLQKGWAGKTIGRAETVKRINPLIKRHYVVNHSADYAIRNLGDQAIADQLEALQKTARADIGKLAEVVFSNGGVAYNGTDLEPSDFDLGATDDEILFALHDIEKSFSDLLEAESDIEHHMRTRAILGVVKEHAAERFKLLSTVTKRRRRPVATEPNPEA